MASLAGHRGIPIAKAIGVYSAFFYGMYALAGAIKEQREKRMELTHARATLLSQAEAQHKQMEKAKADARDERTKLFGADRMWKDRFLRYVQTLQSYEEFEKGFPELFKALNDIAEKVETTNEGLAQAKENEFVFSKCHVLSLLVSAQRWQEDASARERREPAETPAPVKQANDFYTCYTNFLRFLFRSDPFVGAVARYAGSVEEKAAVLLDTHGDGSLVEATAHVKSKVADETARKTLLGALELLAVPFPLHGASLAAQKGYATAVQEAKRVLLNEAIHVKAHEALQGPVRAAAALREREVARSLSLTALETFQRGLMYNLGAK